jgi:hypothetical protein
VFNLRKLTHITKTICCISRYVKHLGLKRDSGPLAELFKNYIIPKQTRSQNGKRFDRKVDGAEIRVQMRHRQEKVYTQKLRDKFWEQRGFKSAHQSYSKEEYFAAETLIFQITQKHYAPELYEALLSNDHSKLNNKFKDLIKVLNLRMSKEGVIKTHGRIMSSSDERKSKFKALIWVPKHGIVAQSILNEAHEQLGHQGQNTSLAFTRS